MKTEITWIELLQASLSEITHIIPEMMTFLDKQKTPLPFLYHLKG